MMRRVVVMGSEIDGKVRLVEGEVGGKWGWPGSEVGSCRRRRRKDVSDDPGVEEDEWRAGGRMA